MPAPTAPVTDKQIRDLRAEARSAGDWRQVDVCDIALGIRPQHTATDRGSIKDSSGRSVTRAKARSICAKAISYGRGAPPPIHHATKKSPAQLQREIDETLAGGGGPNKPSQVDVNDFVSFKSHFDGSTIKGRVVELAWLGGDHWSAKVKMDGRSGNAIVRADELTKLSKSVHHATKASRY